MINLIHDVKIPIPPLHDPPLAFIDYMPLMGIRCTEMDRGHCSNTTFRNVHGVGRLVQRNILEIDTPQHSIDQSCMSFIAL